MLINPYMLSMLLSYPDDKIPTSTAISVNNGAIDNARQDSEQFDRTRLRNKLALILRQDIPR